MKNLKTVALGLMVGAMAIGFSSFTNAHKNSAKIIRNAKGEITGVQKTYFRLAAFASTSTDSDPSHYVFSDTPDADCNTGTSNICRSEWTTDNAPNVGDSPSTLGTPTFVQDDAQVGIYNGQ